MPIFSSSPKMRSNLSPLERVIWSKGCAIPNPPRHDGKPRMDKGRSPLHRHNAFINSVANFKSIKITDPVMGNVQHPGHPGVSGEKASMRAEHQNPCGG